MKIFLGGFFQETNSLSPLLTDVALFRRGKLLEGPAVLDDVLHGSEIGNQPRGGGDATVSRAKPKVIILCREQRLKVLRIVSSPITD